VANPQTVRNEAAAARALLRTLVKQADVDAGDCVHADLPPRECARCTARRELADLRLRGEPLDLLVKKLLVDFQGYHSAFESVDPHSVSGEDLWKLLLAAVGWTREDVDSARDGR
jgi:hypothetical protein